MLERVKDAIDNLAIGTKIRAKKLSERKISGSGVLEAVLIAVVIVALVIIFKDQIAGVITTAVTKLSGKADKVYEDITV